MSAPESKSAPPPRPPRILVVDDSDFDRKLLCNLLERSFSSLELTQATSADEALAAAREHIFDLILLDIQMPTTGGEEVLPLLRSLSSTTRVPVIMISAHGEDEVVARCLRAGANDFITKPVNFAVTRARIEGQLRIAEAEALRLQVTQLETVAAMVITYKHELNNPLAIALPALERVRQNPEDQKAWELLESAVNRLAEVVRAIDGLAVRGQEVQLQDYSPRSKMVSIKKG